MASGLEGFGVEGWADPKDWVPVKGFNLSHQNRDLRAPLRDPLRV